MPVITDPESDRAGVSTRRLLLACLPAVAIGMLIRIWLMHTTLVPVNADEGVTGLQAYEVLRGRFRLIVAGNEYGSTTETYLIAPFLAFWGGVWPLGSCRSLCQRWPAMRCTGWRDRCSVGYRPRHWR